MNGISATYRGPLLVETAVSYFTVADGLVPSFTLKALRAPEEFKRRILYNPWSVPYRAMLDRPVEWGRVLLNAGEAYRRMGRRAEAKELLGASAALRPHDALPPSLMAKPPVR